MVALLIGLVLSIVGFFWSLKLNKTLITCKACGKQVAHGAHKCPHCGAYVFTWNRMGFQVMAILAIFLLMISHFTIKS